MPLQPTKTKHATTNVDERRIQSNRNKAGREMMIPNRQIISEGCARSDGQISSHSRVYHTADSTARNTRFHHQRLSACDITRYKRQATGRCDRTVNGGSGRQTSNRGRTRHDGRYTKFERTRSIHCDCTTAPATQWRQYTSHTTTCNERGGSVSRRTGYKTNDQNQNDTLAACIQIL